MDEFARLQARDRKPYFEQVAADLGFTPLIVEKDFWVCWTLKRLFALSDIGPNLVFKGGTSLSKGYQAIKRFSEDIDLSLDRAFSRLRRCRGSRATDLQKRPKEGAQKAHRAGSRNDPRRVGTGPESILGPSAGSQRLDSFT